MQCPSRRGLRDNSYGNADWWDDPYELTVDFCVIAIFDNEVDLYNGTRQFRFDMELFPHGDIDLLQLNRSRDNVLVFLRGFELEYEATDHFVYPMHASVGVQPVASPVRNSRQNCALGLTDAGAGHQMGGLIHYTALAFPKTYPFLKPDLSFSSKNPNGALAHAAASATIQGVSLAPDQVFYGMTSVDHGFDDSDHKLSLYKAEMSAPKAWVSGKNTKLDFTMAGAFVDASYMNPYHVMVSVAVIVSPT